MVGKIMFAVSLAWMPAAFCNMYDVIEQEKLSPPECGMQGCRDWAGTDAMWHRGAVPANAGSWCAQPGKAVAAHPYGAWCICKNQTGSNTSTLNANHPIGTFNIASAKTDGERGSWLSFDGLDVVLYAPSDPTSDHVPWTFFPAADTIGAGAGSSGVVGKTVFIQENWKAGTDPRAGDFLGFFGGLNLSLHQKESTEATMPWKIVDAGTGDGTVFLQNLFGPPSRKTYGMFAGYPAASTGKVRVQLVPHDDVKNRAAWTLAPAATPQLSGYCVSSMGVPEQINLQVANNNSVVISWVTFESAGRNPPLSDRESAREH